MLKITITTDSSDLLSLVLRLLHPITRKARVRRGEKGDRQTCWIECKD